MPFLVLHILSASVCVAVGWNALSRRGAGALRYGLAGVSVGASLAILGLLMSSVEVLPERALFGVLVTRVGIGITGAGAAGLGLVFFARPGRSWPGWATLGLALLLACVAALVVERLQPEALLRTWAGWYPRSPVVRLYDSLAIAGGSLLLLAGALVRLRRSSRYGRRALQVLLALQLSASALYFALRWFMPPDVQQLAGPVLVAATGLAYAVVLRAWRVAGLNGSALSLLFARMPTPALALDLHTGQAMLNPAALALFGPGPLGPDEVVSRLGLGRHADEVLAEQADRTLRSVRLDGGGERVFDVRCCFDAPGAIGLLLLQEVTERVAHAEHLSRTLTQLRQMQERLVLQEKMAALGVLVAGVNHELNNPLAYVTANLRTVQDYVALLAEGARLAREAPGPLPAPLAAWARSAPLAEAVADAPGALDEALQGCVQMQETIASMRLLSRRDGADEPMDLAQLARAGARIGATSLSPGAVLGVELDEPLPVRGVAGELTRVVTNLVVNAGHALGGRGHIHVRGWRERGWAVLEVADDGPGIPEPLRQRIFEPFFTTKPAGVGTGLGLSISYETARRHGGELLLASGPGEGARFQLRLPLDGAGAAARPHEEELPGAVLPG